MEMRVVEPRAYTPPYPPRPARRPSTLSVALGRASRNPVGMWQAEAFEAPFVTRKVLGVNYHVVSQPDLIRRILVEAPATYVRPRVLAGLVQPSGGGLVMAQGEDWRRQRRVMAPVFTPAAVETFLPLFADAADETADRWDTGEAIDVGAAATGTAFQVISRALFTTGFGLEPEEAARDVRRLMNAAGALRPSLLMLLSLVDGIPRMGPGIASAARLTGRVRRFVAARQAAADPPHDFVTRLLEAFGEDHAPAAAARETTANALGFMIAGHETTASALAFTLYLLSEQPQVQAWAAEEAREALADGASPAQTLEKLTYLHWVVEEAMRLYPPALRIERQAIANDELGALRIRKGDLVAVWPWLVHRHRALWARPDVFDPENFSPEAKAGRHRFQYLPFGAGPRVCIGAQFALKEALLVLAHWLARYEFSPAPGYSLALASDITLKPKGSLPLIVRRRPN